MTNEETRLYKLYNDKYMIFESDESNILISCSYDIKGNMTIGEYNTLSTALRLKEEIPINLIFHIGFNQDCNCAYKESLVNIVKSNKVKFVIDLHSMMKDRELDVVISTGLNYKLINGYNLQSLVDKRTIKVGIYSIFPTSYKETVGRYVTVNSGATGLHLEFNELLSQDKRVLF